MKIVAIYGSSRKNGNGAALVEHALNNFKDKNPEVKKYFLTDMEISHVWGVLLVEKRKCV